MHDFVYIMHDFVYIMHDFVYIMHDFVYKSVSIALIFINRGFFYTFVSEDIMEPEL
jgi:hypothetical protein